MGKMGKITKLYNVIAHISCCILVLIGQVTKSRQNHEESPKNLQSKRLGTVFEHFNIFAG